MAKGQRCRKCGGNLLGRDDLYGEYLACMQCGATQELRGLGSLDEVLAATLGPYRERLGLGPARR